MRQAVYRVGIVAMVVAGFAAAKSVLAHEWQVDDGCAPGLSADGYFFAYGDPAAWLVDPRAGYHGCYMATPNGPSLNTRGAEWYLPTSSSYNHNYGVLASIPGSRFACAISDGAWGHYHRYRDGHAGGITSHHWLYQSAKCKAGGGWSFVISSSSPHRFNGANGGFLDIWTYTYDPWPSYWILVDAVHFAAQ